MFHVRCRSSLIRVTTRGITCLSPPTCGKRYVVRPMLWRGNKFHFRCYATLCADMSAWLYRIAYILSASRPYSLDEERAPGDGEDAVLPDELVHVSNLAVNKHTRGHPGQASRSPPLPWRHHLDCLGATTSIALTGVDLLTGLLPLLSLR